MQGKRILQVGYGKLGQRVAQTLAKYHMLTVIKRSPIEQQDNIHFSYADITQTEPLKEAFSFMDSAEFDCLIYCVSPTERTEQAYREAYLIGLQNVIDTLPAIQKLKQIIFISSTSVYPQEHDEIVDETTICEPQAFSGKILLQAENVLERIDIPTTTVRFSGIYGAGRSRLIDQVQEAINEQKTLLVSKGFSNRIHEDDCVGFICHLVGLFAQGEILETCYVATDSCPVSLADVYAYIAEQLQGSTEQFEIIESDVVPRRAGSKRCVNQRMLESGYQLKYPSYLEGYQLS